MRTGEGSGAARPRLSSALMQSKQALCSNARFLTVFLQWISLTAGLVRSLEWTTTIRGQYRAALPVADVPC